MGAMSDKILVPLTAGETQTALAPAHIPNSSNQKESPDDGLVIAIVTVAYAALDGEVAVEILLSQVLATTFPPVAEEDIYAPADVHQSSDICMFLAAVQRTLAVAVYTVFGYTLKADNPVGAPKLTWETPVPLVKTSLCECVPEYT